MITDFPKRETIYTDIAKQGRNLQLPMVSFVCYIEA